MIDLKKPVEELFQACDDIYNSGYIIRKGTWQMLTLTGNNTEMNEFIPRFGARVYITDWGLMDKVIISGFDNTFNPQKNEYDENYLISKMRQERKNIETIIKYFSDGYVKDKDVELSFFDPEATGSVRLVEIEGKVYYFYFKNTLPRLLQIDRICSALKIENKDTTFKLSLHAVGFAG